MPDHASTTLPCPFGKYELLEHIATGGMAEVYLARAVGAEGIERHLAIKKIRPELQDNPRLIKLFINEARIGVHLNHPNIVQVYELGQVQEAYYIAMEHLHGKDLTRLVKTMRARNERLPIPVCVFLVAELCRGLAHAHQRVDQEGQPLQIIHQDVSPHNVLVTFSGEAKLVDFGIARILHRSLKETPSSRVGPGGGKYAYMSPEQVTGKAFGPRSDIFSAGIVLWELICDRRLFDDPDPNEKLRLVKEAIVPHPETLDVSIADQLWRIIQKALALDPAERYASAEVMEEDLRAWLFEERHRIDRSDVAHWMQHAFPNANDPIESRLDLTDMIADVENLGQQTSSVPDTSNLSATDPLGPSNVGEIKPVSMLTIDIEGLTTSSLELDAEVMVRLNYRLLRWIRQTVERYEGKVHRAVDRRVTVLFGVPKTRTDDTLRALECAQALHNGIASLSSRGVHAQLAMGMHSGDIVVRSSGNRLRYMARGDVAVHARKLCDAADIGETLVSENVYGATRDRYAYSTGPNLKQRGDKHPKNTYRLNKRRSGKGSAPRGPWIVRRHEIETIRDAIVSLSQGKGGAIGFTGETGLGKSRLLREVAMLSRRRRPKCALIRCDRNQQNQPLSILRDLILTAVGLTDKASRAEVARALSERESSKFLSGDTRALMMLWGRDENEDGSHTEIAPALKRLLAQTARSTPLILCLDDLELVSVEAQRALAHVLAVATEAPVLFLATWEEPLHTVLLQQFNTVELAGLQDAQLTRFLEYTLSENNLPDDIYAFFDRTCEGNPLYIEEMSTYLMHQSSQTLVSLSERIQSQQDLHDVPPSLTALLASRIDALESPQKRLLQFAALLGGRFEAPLLSHALGVEDIYLLCESLQRVHLLAPTKRVDEWRLRSTLIQDAALRGLLAAQRADVHRLLSQAIEAVYAETLDLHLEALVHHCAEGGRPLDAARFANQAGMALEKDQRLQQAQRVYEQGLACIQGTKATPETWDFRTQGEAMISCRLGIVLLLLGKRSTALQHLEVALDIASDAGLHWIESLTHLELGRAMTQAGDLERADAHLKQATIQAELHGDEAAQLRIHEAQAELAFERGAHEEAREHWQQVLEQGGEDERLSARCHLGLAGQHVKAGDLAQGIPLLEKALLLARSAGDRILEGRAFNNLGLLHFWSDRKDDALVCFRHALSLREGIGYRRGVVINHHNIGDVYFHAQEWSRAGVAFSRSAELARAMRWREGELFNLVYLHYLSCRLEGAPLDELRNTTEVCEAEGALETATTGSWLIGRHLCEQGKHERALPYFQHGLDLANQLGLRGMSDLLERTICEANEAVVSG